MSFDWKNKTILAPDGVSHFGSHLVVTLVNRGASALAARDDLYALMAKVTGRAVVSAAGEAQGERGLTTWISCR